jgi:D-alanyl-lipoteichoic acid acyltransferase DltB (MBOAT superfamily)
LYFLETFAVGGLMGFAPMAGFIVLSYAAIEILRGKHETNWYWAILVLTLLYFFWLKKYAFVPGVLLLSTPYAGIGVSYIFFRIMQLIIDANSDNISGRLGAFTYLNYVLNFTTLVSGPIQRYEDFSASQTKPKSVTWFATGRSIERIIFGLFKVLVLATIFDEWHIQSLSLLATHDTLIGRATIGAESLVGYTIYLYCNFSGYTDIVIGIARFLGIELPENFNRPFSALNFMDFWARWHMTLSNWLKTYVYNPLVKTLMVKFPASGADPYIGAFAFLLTFFLIGLWHGQTWVFVLYGVILGVGISGNKLYQVLMISKIGRKRYRLLAANWLYQALMRGMTFTYFCLSLVCFWASWTQITQLCGWLGWSGAAAVSATIFVSATVLLEAWERLRGAIMAVELADHPLVLSRYLRTAWSTGLIVITVGVASLTSTPAPDIIYKNF